MPQDELRERRRRLAAIRADVVYDHPQSRVADNFLRTAWRVCVVSDGTRLLGSQPSRGALRGITRFSGQGAPPLVGSSNCTCLKQLPALWWPDPKESGGSRPYGYHGLPSEVCRAGCGAECGVRCTSDSEVRRRQRRASRAAHGVSE